MNTPKYCFILNILIILLVVIVALALLNPLALFGLYFLREIPIINFVQQEEEQEEDDGGGIGFHANV